MIRYIILCLTVTCLTAACLDPFLQDEKRIIDDFYLLKNENHDISVGVGGDGNNYHPLSNGQVVEVFVADSNLYVKEVSNWRAIDTTCYFISMTDNKENVMCDMYTYDSVKNTVALRNGIIISGWYVPQP